jgi:hypothetical protein
VTHSKTPYPLPTLDPHSARGKKNSAEGRGKKKRKKEKTEMARAAKKISLILAGLGIATGFSPLTTDRPTFMYAVPSAAAVRIHGHHEPSVRPPPLRMSRGVHESEPVRPPAVNTRHQSLAFRAARAAAVVAALPVVASAAEEVTAFKSSGAADALGSLELGVLVLGVAVSVCIFECVYPSIGVCLCFFFHG